MKVISRFWRWLFPWRYDAPGEGPRQMPKFNPGDKVWAKADPYNKLGVPPVALPATIARIEDDFGECVYVLEEIRGWWREYSLRPRFDPPDWNKLAMPTDIEVSA